jgi:hypothetical protein
VRNEDIVDDDFKRQTARPLDPAVAKRLLHALGAVRDLEELMTTSHVRPGHAQSQLNRDLAVGNAAFAYNYARTL